MEANSLLCPLPWAVQKGCSQVSHQHQLLCCNDRKRLFLSAGCSDEFWKLSLAGIAFLVPTPPSPYLVTIHKGTKPWECELCRAAALRHLFRQPTQGKLSYAGSRLSHCIRPHPDLGYLNIYAQELHAQKWGDKRRFSSPHKPHQSSFKVELHLQSSANVLWTHIIKSSHTHRDARLLTSQTSQKNEAKFLFLSDPPWRFSLHIWNAD